MRRHRVHCENSRRSVPTEELWSCTETFFGHGCDCLRENYGMATPGWNQRRLVFFLLSLLLFSCAIVSHARAEDSSLLHAGEESSGLVLRDAASCDSATEIWLEGHLMQIMASEASADGASNMAAGPCNRQTTKSVVCPVKCFRADPVCGTDNVTYWCGAVDANCAGVEVAHDGYCNLWELNTNIGSTTALRAAQSLQLVHMLWLVVAGLLIVLGLL